MGCADGESSQALRVRAAMERILALAALALASLLNFNTHRADIEVGQDLMAEEIESLGGDLIQSTFEQIAALPFDAVAQPTSANDLTGPTQFGGAASWDAATDLDDLDGATVMRRLQGASGGGLDYTLAAEVAYVEKSGGTWREVPRRTYFKRLTLTTTGPDSFAATLTSVYTAEGQ